MDKTALLAFLQKSEFQKNKFYNPKTKRMHLAYKRKGKTDEFSVHPTLLKYLDKAKSVKLDTSDFENKLADFKNVGSLNSLKRKARNYAARQRRKLKKSKMQPLKVQEAAVTDATFPDKMKNNIGKTKLKPNDEGMQAEKHAEDAESFRKSESSKNQLLQNEKDKPVVVGRRKKDAYEQQNMEGKIDDKVKNEVVTAPIDSAEPDNNMENVKMNVEENKMEESSTPDSVDPNNVPVIENEKEIPEPVRQTSNRNTGMGTIESQEARQRVKFSDKRLMEEIKAFRLIYTNNIKTAEWKRLGKEKPKNRKKLLELHKKYENAILSYFRADKLGGLKIGVLISPEALGLNIASLQSAMGVNVGMPNMVTSSLPMLDESILPQGVTPEAAQQTLGGISKTDTHYQEGGIRHALNVPLPETENLEATYIPKAPETKHVGIKIRPSLTRRFWRPKFKESIKSFKIKSNH